MKTIKTVYYFTPEENGCRAQLHPDRTTAQLFAERKGLSYIERQKMSEDVVLRLHNNDGGYVIETKIVWQKNGLKP